MNERTPASIGTRILVIRILLLLCVLGLGAKAFQIQVLDKDLLTRKAEQTYITDLTIQGDRGGILDRHQNKLGISIDAPDVTADPFQINHPGRVADQLAKVLDDTAASIEQKLNRKTRYVVLASRVSRDQARAVTDLNIKGIYLNKNSKRFYPNRDLAAQIIGFTGGDQKGLEGLEYRFDDKLEGRSTQTRVHRDRKGQILDIDKRIRDELRGNAIVLTIDKKIQFLSEQALETAVKNNRAKSGMALVMRPDTGELLAVAHYPRFNPNNFGSFDRFNFRNRAVTDAFEPGSIMKVFTVAAAIEKGMSPKSIFFCENGEYRVNGLTVHDTHSYQWLTLTQIIKFSSNIGATKISETIGAKALHHYLTAFGFGHRTGVACPAESSGTLMPYDRWTKIDTSAISFGQAVAVTGVQLISAISAIANDGKLMKPMLVKKIISSTGTAIETFTPTPVRQVVSPRTAHLVKAMMNQVVQKEGTGTQAAMEGYQVCGKTSTAQKAAKGKKGYASHKYTSAFGGFAPRTDPKLAVLVVVDEPVKAHYGGIVAAPAFKTIMSKSFSYMNIPPDTSSDTLIAAIGDAQTKHPAERTAHETP